jgi:iron complex outermembrane recepter protein
MDYKINRIFFILALCFGFVFGGQYSVFAQDSSNTEFTLEEITVTAQKRTESLQDASVAVNTVSGDILMEQGVVQLDAALMEMPSVIVSQSPQGGMVATVRGVGPSLPTQIGGDAGVSTNYDGAYNNEDISAKTGFYDLARIEVIRGPQGTLYGRNAEAGVLNVVSNNPTQKTESAFSAGIGNYKLMQFSGMGNFPINDTLAIRIAASSVNREGFLSNGQDDNVVQGLRAKMLWEPSDSLSLLLGTELTKIDSRGNGDVNTAPFKTGEIPDASEAYTNTYPEYQIYKRHGYKIWAQLEADVGIASLTALPAYQWLSNPEQLMYTGFTKSLSPGEGALIQRSLELRFASKPSSKINWIAGLYGYDLEQQPRGTIGTAIGEGNTITQRPGATPTNDKLDAQSKGVFAQTTIPLMDKLRVIAGGRQSWDEKEAHYSNTNSTHNAEWSSFDWKAGLEYDLAANSMLYLTASTGYRPGGMSPAPDYNHEVFKEEKLFSYEIGSKSELLNKTLRLNGSIYYYDYQNYQVSNLVPNPNFPVGPFFFLDIINLPQVTNKGGELEVQYLLTKNDNLSVAVAYLDSKVIEPVMIMPQRVQMEGQPLPNSPKWAINGNYQHNFILNSGAAITPQINLKYVDDSYVTVPPIPMSNQPSYLLVNAGLLISAASGQWSTNFYGNNLTNEVVKSAAIGTALSLQSPRTYGMTVNFKF